MTRPDSRLVFHLTTPDEWERARVEGELVPRGFGEEGFVHCSTLDQLVGTIERHFAGADELVLLRLGSNVAAELVWEEGRPGQLFPHLYRPLLPSDVDEAIPWRRDRDGAVSLPPELSA